MLTGGETVAIRRFSSSTVDKYGNPVQTVADIPVANVFVSFGSTVEPVDVARNPIDAVLTLYFPPGTVIEPTDEFVVRGDVWQKNGDAAAWAQMDGFDVGVVVGVKRRRG